MRTFSVLAAGSASMALANDPASSWLSYARFDAGSASSKITALNTTWTVPSLPATAFGSNAPGWWFGVMDKDGNGALVQPILAYGYTGSHYSIFNACFDWTDGSWTVSDTVSTVKPGDKITSSVTYNEAANSYTMLISSAQLGNTIRQEYAIEKRQTETESSAVFVLEHQPRTCRAYPTDNEMSFENIYVEVDGKPVTNPNWQAQQEKPACNSKATIVDAATIKFSWDTSGAAPESATSGAEPKWGFGAPIAQLQPKVAMSGNAATHYGDPLAGPCMSDEQNITITGVAGSVCSPAATGGKCPTDTPAGCTITPAAILQDQSGDKYCALECSPSLPIKDQKLADSICGVDNMSCKPISGVGICTYDA